MDNPILKATRDAVQDAGVPERLVAPISDLIIDLLDQSLALTPDDAAKDEIDPDYYFDFLESWDAGHSRFRRWVRFTGPDSPVKLTREGRRVCMHVVNTTPSWGAAFSETKSGE